MSYVSRRREAASAVDSPPYTPPPDPKLVANALGSVRVGRGAWTAGEARGPR